MKCDAKIRPMPDDTELTCELDGEHDTHQAVLRNYAYAGSETKMTWMEDDRRTYHGEYPGRCDFLACILPLGHRGTHAF